MKTRATLALAAVAGLASMAQAQEVFIVSYSWLEVNAGTITAATGPNAGNSVVDPGEGARIRLQVTANINGSSAVGQTTLLTQPINGITSGTVRGLGVATYDLVGDLGGATANGAWNNLAGGAAPLTTGSTGGVPQGAGAIVQAFGGSQFVAPAAGAAGIVNGAQNVQVFRGVWNPATYANRTVNFLGRASVAAPSGQGNAILVQYDTDTTSGGDPTDPTTYVPLHTGKYISSDFGQGLNIPVAPAPSSLALIGLGTLIAGRRRR